MSNPPVPTITFEIHVPASAAGPWSTADMQCAEGCAMTCTADCCGPDDAACKCDMCPTLRDGDGCMLMNVPHVSSRATSRSLAAAFPGVPIIWSIPPAPQTLK
jgi:hypothetical protein